jgi:3-methyl-2-oxobutanoate hydroxymethyltransferase
MSAQRESNRITVPDIVQLKGQKKIVCLTAYTAPIAGLLDPIVDLLLVGDSVGMVVHGLPSTVGVTVEMMIMHGQAVMRGASRALVVVDLLFGSYVRRGVLCYDTGVRLML